METARTLTGALIMKDQGHVWGTCSSCLFVLELFSLHSGVSGGFQGSPRGEGEEQEGQRG